VLAAGVGWGTPEAKSTYGQLIEFQQPATLPVGTSRVEILLDFPGGDGPVVADVGVGVAGTPTILAFNYDTTTSHVYPNTKVGARWRITLADGTTEVGPRVTTTYADTGFQWQSKTGGIVRVHWYEGGEALARQVLTSAQAGIEKATTLLGVTETEPIDVFVYGSEDAFFAAAGPGTREWAGAFALPDIRTLIALIPPDQVSPAVINDYIPHELTHVVFDTAVKNRYHQPPRWLNEGFAVYMSLGFGPDDRTALRRGVADDRIIPLEALTGLFPTTDLQGRLAYAEGVSAVSYIVDTFGPDALAKLIGAYAGGVSDDEAFLAGLGLTVAAFEAEWMSSIGAHAPARAGPLPAPPGPVPSGWTGQSATGATSPAPGSPAPAAPASSGSAAAPGESAGPVASSAGGADAGGGSGTDLGGLLLLIAALVSAIALGGALALRSRRGPPPGTPSGPPAAPLWPADVSGGPASPPSAWPPAPGALPPASPPSAWPPAPEPPAPAWPPAPEPPAPAWPPAPEPPAPAWPPAPPAAGPGATEEPQG